MNSGNIAGSLQIRSVPPGPPQTYFGVADSLIPGVNILAEAEPSPSIAVSLLAAHALECLLKAYLSRKGDDKSVRGRVQHDLNRLWDMAAQQQLPISQAPPDWVKTLSGVHGYPWYLRYSTGINMIMLPNAKAMAAELESLLKVVRANLSNP